MEDPNTTVLYVTHSPGVELEVRVGARVYNGIDSDPRVRLRAATLPELHGCLESVRDGAFSFVPDLDYPVEGERKKMEPRRDAGGRLFYAAVDRLGNEVARVYLDPLPEGVEAGKRGLRTAEEWKAEVGVEVPFAEELPNGWRLKEVTGDQAAGGRGEKIYEWAERILGVPYAEAVLRAAVLGLPVGEVELTELQVKALRLGEEFPCVSPESVEDLQALMGLVGKGLMKEGPAGRLRHFMLTEKGREFLKQGRPVEDRATNETDRYWLLGDVLLTELQVKALRMMAALEGKGYFGMRPDSDGEIAAFQGLVRQGLAVEAGINACYNAMLYLSTEKGRAWLGEYDKNMSGQESPDSGRKITVHDLSLTGGVE